MQSSISISSQLLMARLSCIALFITMNVFMCVFTEEALYSAEFDNIDIQAGYQSADLREEYYKCFMETAPCKTPEQKMFTEMFSEAYQTKCKRCTEKQKETFQLIADWWAQNEPERWQLMVAKTAEDMKKKNANQ